jgi:hypothetical protein
MDESAVRASVEAVGDALVAGDVDTAIGYLSDELKRNPGEVVAMLPLPATEASIVSVDQAPSAVVVVMRLVGETSDVELQTRWKDRDGEPRIVEVSHLSRTEREPAPATGDADDAAGAQGGPAGGAGSV